MVGVIRQWALVCALVPCAWASDYQTPAEFQVLDQVMTLGNSMKAKGLGQGFTAVAGDVKWGNYRIVLFDGDPGQSKTLGKAPDDPFAIAMNKDYWFDGLLDLDSWDTALKAFALMVHEKAHQDLKAYWSGGYCTDPGCFTAIQSLEECLDIRVVNHQYDQNPCHEAWAESREADELCAEACRTEDGVFVHSAEERASLQAAAKQAAGEACDAKALCDAAVQDCLGACDSACTEAFDPVDEAAKLMACQQTCSSAGSQGMPFPDGTDVPPGDCPTTPTEGWSCSCEQG